MFTTKLKQPIAVFGKQLFGKLIKWSISFSQNTFEMQYFTVKIIIFEG